MSLLQRRIGSAGLLIGFLLSLFSVAATAAEDEDAAWTGGLKSLYFGEQAIIESDEVITLDAPSRADSPAFVPITIKTEFPQTEERYIETIYLIVDRNPGALAGTFHFTPKSGRADLALRVRVNAYTPVRAIAQTNQGTLYMSRRFVKATGGCSAPVGTDLEKAMARLGKIKLKVHGEPASGQPTLAHLLVSHPNINGMQMDQLTQLYAPAHFVTQVKVRFDGEEVFAAETDFAISENPSFKFFFVPDGDGELEAEVIDSNGLRFSHVERVTLTAQTEELAQRQE